MSHTCLQYHIIFATKKRTRWLCDDTMPRLVKYFGGIVRDLGGSMVEANGAEDHVHIAAALPPTRPVADILREIKAGSSGWVHREFANLCEFAWQEGYAAFSVSRSAMPKVVDYIRRQKEHHAKMTFVDELSLFLKRHGVEFDPQYL